MSVSVLNIQIYEKPPLKIYLLFLVDLIKMLLLLLTAAADFTPKFVSFEETFPQNEAIA